MQIGPAESPLASFLLVLSFYGESLGGRGFVTVLPTIALQAPLDRARGELPYSGKLSREKTFTNFAISPPSAKVFSTKF